MTDIVRVLRILEYVGPREAVERTLTMNAVPVNGESRFKDLTIRSAVVGTYPEILEKQDAPA